MHKRKVIFTVCIMGVFLLQGCAALPKSSVLFRHTTFLPEGETIPVSVGFEKLDDKRSEEEKKMMNNIPDLADQVSTVLCNDFRDTELFNSIKLNYSKDKVDIIMRGEIRSFFWESGYSPTTFIPYISLVHLLGIPCGSNKGAVELYLELIDAKTGEKISDYDENSNSERAYSIYQASSHRSSGGEETSDAFRVVVDILRKDILSDREKILK